MLSRYGPKINSNSIIDLYNLAPATSQFAVYILVLVLRHLHNVQLDDDQFKCRPHKRDFGSCHLNTCFARVDCTAMSAGSLSTPHILWPLGKKWGFCGDNNSPGLLKRSIPPSISLRCSKLICTACVLWLLRRRIEESLHVYPTLLELYSDD